MDAARRLGPAPGAAGRLASRAGAAGWRAGALRDAAVPAGRFPAGRAPPAARCRGPGRPATPCWPAPRPRRRRPTGMGPSRAAPHALGLDLFAPGDIRPVWERNRWAELPLLAQAARLDPGGGHLARAEALLADWAARNPPFRGPNWACGQEAALRALHLGLALALLGADHAPPPGARALLALHGRRIAATPAYALAQDNNHPVSEAAGLLACGLLLGEAGWTARGAARLDAALRRLVAPDGVLRPGLDRLPPAAAGRAGGGRMAAPPAGRAAAARHRPRRGGDALAAPAGGARRPAPCRGSATRTARPSPTSPWPGRTTRGRAWSGRRGCSAAARPASPAEPGCAWLGPARRPAPWPRRPPPGPARGCAAGRPRGARACLRTGPLRFRPGQADLLHLDLWDGPLALLRDGGTGAYNPAPGRPGGTPISPAPPRTTPSPSTARTRCRGSPASCSPTGRRRARCRTAPGCATGAAAGTNAGSRVEGRRWVVEDRLGGPFRRGRAALAARPRRLARPAGRRGGPAATLRVTADAPLRLRAGAGLGEPRLWRGPAGAGAGRAGPESRHESQNCDRAVRTILD